MTLPLSTALRAFIHDVQNTAGTLLCGHHQCCHRSSCPPARQGAMARQPHMNRATATTTALLKDSQVPHGKDATEESSLTASFRQGELIKLMVRSYIYIRLTGPERAAVVVFRTVMLGPCFDKKVWFGLVREFYVKLRVLLHHQLLYVEPRATACCMVQESTNNVRRRFISISDEVVCHTVRRTSSVLKWIVSPSAFRALSRRMIDYDAHTYFEVV